MDALGNHDEEPGLDMTVEYPKVIDNDKDEIIITLGGKELRGWSYASDDERRQKMVQAREYVEGYCNGRDDTKELFGLTGTV